MPLSSQLGLPIEVSKLGAALRQLDTALFLWFTEADPVSTHTLACAAHEILHDLNRKAKGPRLLFDSALFDDKAREQVISILKAEMNYFKHGDGRRSKKNQTPQTIPLHPEATLVFLVAGVTAALLQTEASPSDAQAAFFIWCQLHRPNLLEAAEVEKFENAIPIDKIAYLRSLRRTQLYEVVVERQNALRAAGSIV